MIRSYLKVAWRNLLKNRLYSFINIAGLATGMAVALLIGLWIYDELTFDKKDSTNYDLIAKVSQNVNFGEGPVTYDVIPIPLAKDMRNNYPDFQYVSLSAGLRPQVLGYGDKLISRKGDYVEPGFPVMMTLKMISGDRTALNDMHAVLLSRSVAIALFGAEDPMGKIIKINNRFNLTVRGVYEDFARNSSFTDYSFLGQWDMFMAINKFDPGDWDNNSWLIFAMLKPGGSFAAASAKIQEARTRQGNVPGYHPKFFLQPMTRWHLYGEFKNGVNKGGLITFVWLFAVIGGFVLLLACINFMNLSTARSERRAREIGIRKAIGSVRRQLIAQFLIESLLVAAFAFVLSLLLVEMTLPFFNTLADKSMSILWSRPAFWISAIAFTLLTGLLAGSYPALYLSSFRPVKVLKGTFKSSRLASIPRQVLVTVQFSVSVLLIIGTLVVYRQIQYARNQPIGYDSSGLIEMPSNTQDLEDHAQAIRTDLLASGAATAYAESSCPITANYGGTVAFSWPAKDPSAKPLFNANTVTPDFGRAIGWQIIQGRDFREDWQTDSASVILNESAVKKMGLKNPVGTPVQYGSRHYTVIGVSKDMVRTDPFQTIQPSFYCLQGNGIQTIEVKLNTHIPTSEALAKTAAVFKKYNPSSPFTYHFVDEEYAKKFGLEQRIGSLSAFFASLAIFISCLGLFGLASYVAEQRTKEIGIRKVLGASHTHLWRLLSTEFFLLVAVSFLIAMPAAWFLMNKWLLNYEVRTNIPWWIFAAAGCAALLLTLITVSSQALRAGLRNPVKSLRSE